MSTATETRERESVSELSKDDYNSLCKDLQQHAVARVYEQNVLSEYRKQPARESLTTAERQKITEIVKNVIVNQSHSTWGNASLSKVLEDEECATMVCKSLVNHADSPMIERQFERECETENKAINYLFCEVRREVYRTVLTQTQPGRPSLNR